MSASTSRTTSPTSNTGTRPSGQQQDIPVRDLDSQHLRAWRTFLEAHAHVTEVLGSELRERSGMPLTWYDVLVQLSEADGGRLRMQELAAAVLLSKSGVTRLVDRMEREGLVARSACEDDRRGTFAQLTPAGHERLVQAYPTHLAGVQEHFAGHLDDLEAATLARLLQRVVDANARG